MHRRNNGANAVLDIADIQEEAESIDNRRRLLQCRQSRFPFLKLLLVQTVPLFRPPYLQSTLITTAIQFCVFHVCNG